MSTIPPNPDLTNEFVKLGSDSKSRLLTTWRKELDEVEKRANTDPSAFIRMSMKRSAVALRARIEQLEGLQE